MDRVQCACNKVLLFSCNFFSEANHLHSSIVFDFMFFPERPAGPGFSLSCPPRWLWDELLLGWSTHQISNELHDELPLVRTRDAVVQRNPAPQAREGQPTRADWDCRDPRRREPERLMLRTELSGVTCDAPLETRCLRCRYAIDGTAVDAEVESRLSIALFA